MKELQALEKRGVLPIVCSTWLDYYDLADKRVVGVVGSMADIVEAQWRADKVITL